MKKTENTFEFDKYKITLFTDAENNFTCALIQDISIPQPVFNPNTYLADYNVICRIYPRGVVPGNLAASNN